MTEHHRRVDPAHYCSSLEHRPYDHRHIDHTPAHRSDVPYDQEGDRYLEELEHDPLAGPRVLFLAMALLCVPLALVAGAIGWAGGSVTAYVTGAALASLSAFGVIVLWIRGESR